MSERKYDRLKIFTGSANPTLAQEIAEHLGVPVGEALVGRFSNGEIRVVINESVRGADVFVIQPTCAPVNETVMELLIMIDALRRASARRIVAVIPYYGYARQDRKTRAREPITAKLVANLIVAAGADRVLAMDLHAGQIQGFFDIPLDHLSAVPILGDYFASKGLKDMVIVSPDVGGVTRARDLAHRLRAPIAMIEKRRPEPSVAEVMNIIGEIEGRAVIMVDDMIDTAGSVVLAARAFAEQGAREIYACCTHLVLSGPAKERIESSSLKEVVGTNTVPLAREASRAKFKVLSVAGLLAEAIGRIHLDQSVSALFE